MEERLDENLDLQTRRWIEKQDRRERLAGKLIVEGPRKSRQRRRFEAAMKRKGRVEAEDGTWVQP